MKRAFSIVTSLAVVMCMMGEARAATVKWCFDINTWYDYDWENGEDVLLPNEPGGSVVTVNASYLHMALFKCMDSNCMVASPALIWDGYLDQLGCSPTFSINAGTHKFKFLGVSKAHPEDGNGRWLYVLPDGVKLEDGANLEEEERIISWAIPSGSNVYPVNLNFSLAVRHMLGVGCTALTRTSYNHWLEDTKIWMSSSSVNECGTFSQTGYDVDDFDICISESSLVKKFTIGHQFGEVFGLMNDGLHNGSYRGSEGLYRASGINGRCDCDTMYSPGTRSFCLGSREFTGAAQRQGYASFQAATIMNTRSSVYGVYVNNSRVMKWSSTHGGTLPTIYDPIWPPPDPYYLPPFPVDLDNDENVKWMEYECNPSGTFTHFGTEWDWMDFFWNLWTEGGTSNRYDVDAINAIWHGLYAPGDPISEISTEYASLCCTTSGGNPASCVKRDLDVEDDCGEGTYEDHPTEFKVGRLWSTDMGHGVNEGVLQDAEDLYGLTAPTKYTHFLNTGDDTGVNH